MPQVLPGDGSLSAAAVDGAPRFWVWMSLFLGCGWALSAAWWWSRERSRRQGAGRKASPGPLLSHARRDLQRTCGDNDAVAARRALLEWGRALLAPERVANLRALCDRLGEDLRHEVEALNQSLYAPDEHPWQGQSLWALCGQLEKQQSGSRREALSELLPLNP